MHARTRGYKACILAGTLRVSELSRAMWGEGRKDRGPNWIDELGRAEVDTELTDWSVLADVRWVRESHEQRKKMEISALPASRLSCVVQ